MYSDADRNALHVKMADEAVHIGPPPANQSYIVIDKIMDAIRQTGAEAVQQLTAMRTAIGTQAGPARIAEIVTGAGFASCRTVAQTPFHRVLVAERG